MRHPFYQIVIVTKRNSATFLKKITKLNLLSFTQDALIKLVLNAIMTEVNIIHTLNSICKGNAFFRKKHRNTKSKRK